MKTKRYVFAFTFAAAAALLAPALTVAAFDMEPGAWMEEVDETSVKSDGYRAGRRALEAEEWAEAVERFSEAAAAGGVDADGALYWQAYALLKLNRPARAQRAIDELRERFPESQWVDDARALEVATGRDEGREADLEAVENEELKLYAIHALLQVEWERAKPLLRKFLTDASPEMMERVLFVLSQSDHPEAREMLVGVARTSDDPAVVGEAAHFLGFYGDEAARTLLRQLYSDSPHPEIREAVLEAMMISEDVEGILTVARTEADTELRQTAVEQLGILEAVAELRQLYSRETEPEVRQQILEALMLAGDKETLLGVTRNESDPELRATAIEQLGLLEAWAELREFYRAEASPELRGHIAEALMLAGDAEFLIEIAETDQSLEVRHAAIEGIGLVDSDAADAALAALYEKADDTETKRQIIEAFLLQDNAEALIQILETERDPELRMAAFETLSMMGSETATEFMLQILEEDDG